MRYFLYFLVFIPLICFSSPTPFGLEINKASISIAKRKYKSIYKSDYVQKTGLSVYDLSDEDLIYLGLKKLSFVFSEDNKLVGAYAILSKNNFDYFFNLFSKKYHLISNDNPYYGDRNAIFSTGLMSNDTVIVLKSTVKNSDMSLTYMTRNLIKQLNK